MGAEEGTGTWGLNWRLRTGPGPTLQGPGQNANAVKGTKMQSFFLSSVLSLNSFLFLNLLFHVIVRETVK